jgi:hypothetical protein
MDPKKRDGRVRIEVHLAEYRVLIAPSYGHDNEPSNSITYLEFSQWPSDFHLPRKQAALLHGVS